MTPRSLGLRTEAWFVEEVDDLGDALALRTPSIPDAHWGNLLAFAGPPGAGDRGRWEARFAETFARDPGVTHATFAWDDPHGREGDLASFEDAGYDVDRNTVRTATPRDLAAAPPQPPGFALRRVDDAPSWRAFRAVQHSGVRDTDEAPEAYARFLRRVLARTLRWVRDGGPPGLHGGWYLATLDGQPAGTMGLYVREGLGRFQDVRVVPTLRRRGVASAMVHAVARDGFARLGAARLVIMADEGASADRIYGRLGFRQVERFVGVCHRDVRRRAETTPTR
ncbi:MAG: GNAT family N-acetyltransferase [Trueperaceae bacterium]|nr:GNAT family N-acetyltransferase [Trueperaceae bacterium]